eukprot:Sspe_Gene.29394::Locus_13922_Transcript_1_2_Confidence_0.667_Length_859::g.29394::m.29394
MARQHALRRTSTHNTMEPTLERRKSSFFYETMKPKSHIALTPQERAALSEAFEQVVGDQAGITSVAELKHLLELLHQPEHTADELQAVFLQADENRDSRLTFDEFVKYLESEKCHFKMRTSPNLDVLNTFVAFGGNK